MESLELSVQVDLIIIRILVIMEPISILSVGTFESDIHCILILKIFGRQEDLVVPEDILLCGDLLSVDFDVVD